MINMIMNKKDIIKLNNIRNDLRQKSFRSNDEIYKIYKSIADDLENSFNLDYEIERLFK